MTVTSETALPAESAEFPEPRPSLRVFELDGTPGVASLLGEYPVAFGVEMGAVCHIFCMAGPLV